MLNTDLETFLSEIDQFPRLPGKTQVDYFAYFLSSIKGLTEFTAKQIEECFVTSSLKQYSRMAVYLSEEATKSRGGKYIKCKTGYRLERSIFDEIRQKIEQEPKKIHVSQQLSSLVGKISDPQEVLFLEEAIKCYKVEAFRATIILTWILVVDHLQKYIFSNSAKLGEFNKALSKNPDKKIKAITNYDEFSELGEAKFVELMRAAGVVTNDVRKILDEKLGIRNSAAHPSAIIIDGFKATEFVVDLVNNVLLKY